ncbi:MAG: hypothetical protein GDA48_24320 [Hormoscilla sp. GM102CHS1]|nr:hypothetical protein [Hormoscilla sp. GM102CHS1]MBC6474085.1 hypothetical protein [Hormoscilla sp. GM102CHS1]MBC6474719.1 hypothetical protein [Hormoscilla sp. GM102CHS1]MBC6475540.1 hypothetical protein [Hormoscilla sp. GM102CHS1]
MPQLTTNAIARPSNINPCHRDGFDEGKILLHKMAIAATANKCDRLL